MATCSLKNLCNGFTKLRIDLTFVRQNGRFPNVPRYRPPNWFVQKERVASDDSLTPENRQFLQEILQDKLEVQKTKTSPLVLDDSAALPQWDPRTRRVGLIGRKIGNYPLWLKNGKKIQTTLIQVVDNHVIKYIPPGVFDPMIVKNRKYIENPKLGCLLVGAETVDPSTVTKEYCGLFNKVGMLPKRHLCRFMISPHAALPTGTPLFATHYRAGDVVDVRAKTIDRGFQGVIVRWGFKGMPASHGVTKTHRRPGNIGAGGNKARVWPGTKMPGHMGNSWRILRGVKILRINTEHNVLWMTGVCIPGETGAMCYIYDTVLPKRKPTSAPPFPTHTATGQLPDEYYDESVHSFDAPTLAYEESG